MKDPIFKMAFISAFRSSPHGEARDGSVHSYSYFVGKTPYFDWWPREHTKSEDRFRHALATALVELVIRRGLV